MDRTLSEDDLEKRKTFSEKIDSAFYDMVQEVKKSGIVSQDQASRQQLKVTGDRVQTQINVQPDDVEKARAAVESAGGEVTGVSMDRKVIQAWVPVSKLEYLAEKPPILYIRKPAYAVPLDGK